MQSENHTRDPDPPRPQFSIRFLFLLLALTSFACSVCISIKEWTVAGPIFVTGLLIYHTRNVRYAVIPGVAIGFLYGVVTNRFPLNAICVGIYLASIFGSINAMFRGFAPRGFLSLITIIVSMYVIGALQIALGLER
jgi:hypothetical protein